MAGGRGLKAQRSKELGAEGGGQRGVSSGRRQRQSRSDEATRSQTGLDAVDSGREGEQVIRFTHRNRYSVIGVSVCGTRQ